MLDITGRTSAVRTVANFTKVLQGELLARAHDALGSVPPPPVFPESVAAPPMKEYRLLAWPEHSAEFQRTAYRRVLSEMSLRYMSVAQARRRQRAEEAAGPRLRRDARRQGAHRRARHHRAGSSLDSVSAWGWLRRAINVSSDRR